MFRFALAESASPRNYVQAASEAGDDAVNIQRVVDRGKPNYAKQVLGGAENASLERVNRRNNELMLKETELLSKISSDNLNTKYQLDRDRQAIENQKKFAGKLALAGYSVSEAFQKEKELPQLDYAGIRDAILKSGSSETLLNEVNRLREEIDNMRSTMNQPTDQSSQLKIGDEVGYEGSVYPVGGGSSIEKVGYNPAPDLNNPNRHALSQVVQYAEGTRGPDAHRIMFGHTQSNPRLLNDFSRHPNSPYPTPWGTTSEAAGAYQFMDRTWQDVLKANPIIRDFSPESQERAYDWLAKRRGVIPTAPITNIDQFTDVMSRLSPEWSSLPYQGGQSYYDQPSKSINELWSVYNDALKNPPNPTGMI